jgi:phosphoglycerate dehydrogenase-like enzyme
MRSLIIVHPDFDAIWPWAGDHFHALWRAQGEVEFIRQPPGDTTPISRIARDPGSVTRLAVLGSAVTEACVAVFGGLREATIIGGYGAQDAAKLFAARGVKHYAHPSEGFWGQSVSEFGFALTLCGLRRIPQTHHAIISGLTEWNYDPPGKIGRPGARGHQYGDDSRFTNGTLEGKRVRIVGAGNIASRYASFCATFGADVAAWDPFASEPCFHRAGSRREWHLDRLVGDAEIFVPMVPLTDKTRGLVTAAHIDALPRGCLVVMVTRAMICDVAAVRRRVLADELALAADVFDVEPLPLDDALLGRHNVVHTPHNAGRTRQANEAFAAKLAEQFLPR